MAVADEVRDAAGDDARLARSGAGENQQRPVDVQDRFALFGVEGVEELHAGGLRLGLGDLASSPARQLQPRALFDRHALGEIARLIDVAAAADGDVVREQLQRHDHHDRRQQLRRRRQLDARSRACWSRIDASLSSPRVVSAMTDPPRAFTSCMLPIIFSNT